MRAFRLMIACLFLLAAALPPVAGGQARPDPTALMAAQREAMKRFDALDGTWRGTAWIMLQSGEKHQLTQTERVGSFLDGTIKVVEGTGYEADGSVGFNALGIISYDPQSDQYSLRSYARGQSGDFVVTPTGDGFQWEIPAGPMTIRYTASISDGTWTETGHRIGPNGEAVRFSELTLTRLGDSTWPNTGRVPPE